MRKNLDTRLKTPKQKRFRLIIATFTSGIIYPTFASWIFKEDCTANLVGMARMPYPPTICKDNSELLLKEIELFANSLNVDLTLFSSI